MVNRFLNFAIPSLQVINLNLILFILDFFFLGCKRENIQSENGMPKVWVTQLPAENYYCSPALSIDEKILYFGTSALPDIHKKSQYFVALDAGTGKEVWRLQLGSMRFVLSQQYLPIIQFISLLRHAIQLIVQFKGMNYGISPVMVILSGNMT